MSFAHPTSTERLSILLPQNSIVDYDQFSFSDDPDIVVEELIYFFDHDVFVFSRSGFPLFQRYKKIPFELQLTFCLRYDENGCVTDLTTEKNVQNLLELFSQICYRQKNEMIQLNAAPKRKRKVMMTIKKGYSCLFVRDNLRPCGYAEHVVELYVDVNVRKLLNYLVDHFSCDLTDNSTPPVHIFRGATCNVKGCKRN